MMLDKSGIIKLMFCPKKLHKEYALGLTFALLFSIGLSAQTSKVRLWSKADGKGKNHAELWYFAPEGTSPSESSNSLNTVPKTKRKAVIICPGGSYHHLGLKGEGVRVARWFKSIGYAAYVLRYRVAMNGFHHPAMLEDMERAMDMVKQSSENHGVNPDSIGVIGFSAGGHLVLMAGAFLPDAKKPAWIASIYPVVSMQDDIAHIWSRKSLLGKHPTQEQKDTFSKEMQIPDNMPAVYLQASDDDDVVNPQNSIRLAETLSKKHINHKFNHLTTGGHGYGMKPCKFNSKVNWQGELQQWLYFLSSSTNSTASATQSLH